jgi:hypothetical protein
MPTASPRRVRFTVLPRAHEVHGCTRCRRKIRTGERAVSIVGAGSVSFQHAGRTCPPPVFDRHPFIR